YATDDQNGDSYLLHCSHTKDPASPSGAAGCYAAPRISGRHTEGPRRPCRLEESAKRLANGTLPPTRMTNNPTIEATAMVKQPIAAIRTPTRRRCPREPPESHPMPT